VGVGARTHGQLDDSGSNMILCVSCTGAGGKVSGASTTS
jgi:hypothetical protein